MNRTSSVGPNHMLVLAWALILKVKPGAWLWRGCNGLRQTCHQMFGVIEGPECIGVTSLCVLSCPLFHLFRCLDRLRQRAI